MSMRYIEWIVMFCVAGLGMALANLVGFGVDILTSLPGIGVLIAISLAGVFCSNVIPCKLPVIAYCSIIALLLACPISPISTFVIASAGAINFTAPLTMVGAFAGISISNELTSFAKQGWKMIFIAFLVMTGTFVGSAIIAQITLALTGAI